MKRTMASVIIMVISGIVGLYAGMLLNDAMGGAMLFAVIAGIACIINAIENR